MNDTVLDYDQLRYNMVQQKASHNSYQRTEGLVDQMLYWRLRAVEMDIHNSNNLRSWPALDNPPDWYVYHTASGSDSNIARLSDGLKMLLAFHEAVPEHEIVTVFVDIKDPFDQRVHTPEAFDQLLVEVLGRDKIVAPADLLGDQSTLQDAITAHGWPYLQDLRGKFLFALTTGDIDDPNANIYSYASTNAEANARLAFLAPNLSASSQIDSKSFVVLFNLSESNWNLGSDVFDAGFVSRGYTPNSEGAWNKAVGDRIHVLATDKVNSLSSPWARTDNAHGWPFQGNGVTLNPDITEPGTLYGLQANGGAIGGSSDSFYFAFDERSRENADRTHVVFLGDPDSHVEASTVGGLMMRTSLDDNAAFFAVLRTGLEGASFDDQIEGILVMFRPASGQPAQAIYPSVDENSLPGSLQRNVNAMLGSDALWLKLEISQQGSTAAAWFSYDGTSWIDLIQQSFSDPLLYQGWAAASGSDGESVKFLFGDESGKAPASTGGVGGSSGQLFEGVYPPP